MNAQQIDDEFQWLEDVGGDVALDWVRKMNAETEGDLFLDPRFETLRADVLRFLEADDRIPMPSRSAEDVLNFWTDSSHRRGLLRRTSWAAYRGGDPEWETVLDVDALAEAEGESWVFHGWTLRKPARRRALVALSPGGSDASTTREFDMIDKRFIPAEEGGFVRPVAKGSLHWIDDDTVYVVHDFGPDSLTTSGYGRTIRRWRRGTPIEDAELVFEGEPTDVLVGVSVSTLPGHEHHLFMRMIDFYNTHASILRDGKLVDIDVPTHAEVDVRETWLLIRPREEWAVGGRTYAAGSLLVSNLDGYLAGDRSLEVLFEPTPSTSLNAYFWTRNHLLLGVQEHVRDRVEVLTPADGWSRRLVDGMPEVWSLAGAGMDADETDECLLMGNDFVTPATLFYATIDPKAQQAPEILREAPERFDASGLAISQHFATSADGTQVPYFLVGPKDGHAAPAPTLLGGYGGFEVSNTAQYSALIGRGWLAEGGTYALANIRGGGEYGPNWHRAGLRENRHRVYEDFEAVARDLVTRGITTPRQLGITGGSNGGLLVGNMYVRSPELFGAIVCQVPLLDMKRYSHLLAGASWMAEYGDPDNPDDWEFIRTFSPYHLIEADKDYPPLLLTTSTRDDRVHPGHARKMAAALTKQGHKVSYWENIEGGHGGAADAPQQAVMSALAYTFLRRHLF